MKYTFLGLITLLILGTSPTYGQLSTEDALNIYERIHHLMAPRLAQKHIQVELDIKQTTYPGAYARWSRHLKEGVITLSPELFVMPEVTHETLALLICHEFGHFLGGAPTITQKTDSAIMARMMRNPFQNLSVEGQADFFATSTCYRDYFEKHKTLEQMKDDLDSFLFLLQKLMLIQDIHVPDVSPNRHTPSIARAATTLSMAGEYPTLQCRLDTLIQGLYCPGVDEVSGECLDNERQRPACWFKDSSAD